MKISTKSHKRSRNKSIKFKYNNILISVKLRMLLQERKKRWTIWKSSSFTNLWNAQSLGNHFVNLHKIYRSTYFAFVKYEVKVFIFWKLILCKLIELKQQRKKYGKIENKFIAVTVIFFNTNAKPKRASCNFTLW